MAPRTEPPFRADHVGSLLRPPELHQAREDHAAGRIADDELRAVEDEAIREVVRMQEDVGLQSATDGEFRRATWHMDFIYQLGGISKTDGDLHVTFHNEQGDIEWTPASLHVDGPIHIEHTIFGDAFEFLKSTVTHNVPKLTIPSPSMVHYRGGRAAIDPAVYADDEQFWTDLSAAYADEVRRIAELGCTYLQLDDTSLAYLNDPRQRAEIAARGDDAEHQHLRYIKQINAALADRPPGMRVTTHMCRGNFRSSWVAEGGYDFVAEALFSELTVDGFFLEYDDARSGGFEPLRFVPKGKMVVLGLVTTKRGDLEDADTLKRRIEEASRFIDVDQLCLSPQCGFSSTVEGNTLTRDQQIAKLRLIVDVAQEVWGRYGPGAVSTRRVIVIGGGVGGLSAAHELARRGGFEVVVYEARDVAGGKARSMDAIPGTGGRLALPGEHGFRFFPGFYRHLPDTMSRIPYGRLPNGVFDNLVTSTQIEVAREDDLNELITPAHFPVSVSDWEAIFRFVLDFTTTVGMPLDDQVFFVRLLSDLMSACDQRRFGEYENETWWDFSDAANRSAPYQRFAADGLTRSLVAARAREMSARTGGYILLQLLRDLSTPGAKVDRVLNGPTSEVWIDPWTAELQRLGVEIRLGCPVEEIRSTGGRVTGIAGAGFEDSGDYYVAAVPVEVLRERIAMDDLRRHSPALAGLDSLVVRWMNGLMFYLGRDVPLVHGHTIYIDSPWALTSISQAQFWPAIDLHDRGAGDVGGILSIDISDWDTPGAHTAAGKAARDCTPQEVADEAWAQLKAALDDGGEEVLADANRVAWFLDPDIVPPNPPVAGMNLEPLLVNTAGSWAIRPEAQLPEVDNLFLASDYVRTFTDLATMEGANEAARRAVNAILDASGSDAERCGVWPLQEAGGLPFAAARELDRVVYRVFGSHRGPPSTVKVSGGAPKLNPLAGLRL